MTTTVILDPAGKSFTMRRGVWSSVHPIAHLPKWLAFYRRQQELHPAHAELYAESCNTLERLAAAIGRSSVAADVSEEARVGSLPSPPEAPPAANLDDGSPPHYFSPYGL